jgi:hypothetical protein
MTDLNTEVRETELDKETVIAEVETKIEVENKVESPRVNIPPVKVHISQTVAILMDGNNIERSIHSESNNTNSMLNIDSLIPVLLAERQLNRMIYFREGRQISS